MNSNRHTRRFCLGRADDPAGLRPCRLATYRPARGKQVAGAPAGPSPSEILLEPPGDIARKSAGGLLWERFIRKKRGSFGAIARQSPNASNLLPAQPFWGLPHRPLPHRRAEPAKATHTDRQAGAIVGGGPPRGRHAAAASKARTRRGESLPGHSADNSTQLAARHGAAPSQGSVLPAAPPLAAVHHPITYPISSRQTA